ncbi:hypothetical protein CU097_014408 [Rhizopus azygosporus]|uniref:Dolichyldiphosphatase n=1 Tax=Rhizopus azygosporus TaxID=86630 RepID=A0A367K9B9_RHIAZ|nr:hypothetical protein CU097_014408 [Rhizopus azygosporus]
MTISCHSNEGHALASISLTHVYFDPQDKISYAFAYITLAPIAILVFYASVIVSRREMAGILMLLGQLLNEVINYLLKEAIEQERPYAHLGDGYGMPSSHSQFIWYFAVYGALYLVKNISFHQSIWKVLISNLMLLLAILVSISRVYLGYHTLNQVIAGSCIGTCFGICWFALVQLIYSTGIIDTIIDSPLAKMIYLKDMRMIDNVVEWEYQQWEKTNKGQKQH